MTTQNIPRPEHPEPQLVREAWINLNGDWAFEMDFGRSGRERGLTAAKTLQQTIRVPFCPESRLSGIAYTDFMPAVWYTRTVTLPESWLASGRVLLHFGAVDYAAEVWVNGASAGTHRGGYSPFVLDVTKLLTLGENRITVCAEDDVRNYTQPAGKQSTRYHSYECSYTRTTGIWQTVWMEHVAETYVHALRVTPDVANECAHVTVLLNGAAAEATEVTVTASYEGVEKAKKTVRAHWRTAELTLDLPAPELWEPGCGRLYDLTVSLSTGDCVQSYFGMRDVDLDGKAMRINGKIVFQRLILDQGFYPDGIYTAPDDGELRADIERSMAMGFNGARLHQKVFEPRFLYWADKLGYLCWDEHANWMLDISNEAALLRFLPEWEEVVERDYSHPCIVGWCPLNETQRNQNRDFIAAVYHATRRLDPTRPIIDTSGWHHVLTDVFDTHDYTQDAAKFAENHQPAAEGRCPVANEVTKDVWTGEIPYFVSEFGGARWSKQTEGWGYGNGPKTVAEFIERYDGLVTALLENPSVCAFCYTQLTDVEQEQNGLYTYDRQAKFDPAAIRACTAKPAAIEREKNGR